MAAARLPARVAAIVFPRTKGDSRRFFFSSRGRHTRLTCDWSSDVCSSDLGSGGHGGGIFNAGSGQLTVTNSMIVGNAAGNGGAGADGVSNGGGTGGTGGEGGGIFNNGGGRKSAGEGDGVEAGGSWSRGEQD